MQLVTRNVLCKQSCASGLQQFKYQVACNMLYRGRNCCTMHGAKTSEMFSRDAIASSSSSNPRKSTNILDSASGIGMLSPRPPPLRRSHPFMSPSHTRSVSVFGGRFELYKRPSVGETLRISGPSFSDQVFSDNFFLRFSRFSDQPLLLRKRPLRKKVLRKRFFMSNKLGFVVISRTKTFFDHFFSVS